MTCLQHANCEQKGYIAVNSDETAEYQTRDEPLSAWRRHGKDARSEIRELPRALSFATQRYHENTRENCTPQTKANKVVDNVVG